MDTRSRYAAQLVNRYLSERERRPVDGPERAFCVHLTFVARDSMDARTRAVAMVEGLATLRSEVAPLDARVSPADRWRHSEPLFCGSAGPDGEVCADLHGHPGFHSSAAFGVASWGDGDHGTSA